MRIMKNTKCSKCIPVELHPGFSRIITLKFLPVFLLACLFMLNATALRADEVVMDNGDRLTGTVVRMTDGALDFETGYAGVISLEWAKVRELNTDTPMRLQLENGELFNAQQLIREQQQFRVAADQAGEEHVVSVAGINPSTWETGEGYKLSGRVDLSLTADRGNTDKDEIDVSADLEWRYLQHRVKLFSEIEYDVSDGDKTKDKWQLSTKYDRFVSDKRYYGIGLFLEHDKFANLDLRTSIGPYIGQQFYSGEKMNLSAEIGVTYVLESYESAPDDDYVAAAWSIDFDRFLIPSVVQFYHRQNGFLKVEDPGDVVLDTWTGLRFPLPGGFSTSAEVKAEYDADPAGDAEEWDTSYRLKLGYEW